MKSLRIVLALSEPPLPFGHAVGRWYYVLLRGLVERGHRVACFAICDDASQASRARELFPAPTFDLRLYAHPGRRTLWQKCRTLRRPYSYMIDRRLYRDLSEECRGGCDVLHLEGIWSGWLGQGCDPAKVVLNFHSLYDIDLDGVPARGWERVRRTLRRKAEHRLLRSYGTLLTLTPRLKQAVRAIAPAIPVHVVPLGLDLSLYPFIPAERRPAEPVISLIGSMNWYPSYSAAVRLLTRLFPAIRRRRPDARLQIVGWEARHSLRDHLPQAGVTVAENVADTRPFFERTAVFLYAPERGSGMKVKILEAFAYGVPVVTTSEGIEGLDALDELHVGCSDSDEGLVARALALLDSPALQERQRLAARDLVNRQCHPQAVLDRLEICYADMIARRERIAA
jgi:polysaccharide biosynthesis protein PslH